MALSYPCMGAPKILCQSFKSFSRVAGRLTGFGAVCSRDDGVGFGDLRIRLRGRNALTYNSKESNDTCFEALEQSGTTPATHKLVEPTHLQGGKVPRDMLAGLCDVNS